ncbi:MAG: carboxypeptidase-like regulatory domain-containing protein, partial [Bacteroidaceae bacterium]|nr:carboxypeptidase-like regulatory domain-containing protein [Bacteroidaceae bacterium]
MSYHRMTKQLHFLFFYVLLLCLPRVAWAQEPVVPDSALSSTLGLDQEEELPQSRYKLNVRGTVFENQSLKPLADATVKLTTKGGQLVAGAMTKENGQYVLQNVPSGSYTLRVTFMGFKEQTFALTLPEKNGNYKVTDVLMREEATMMQEA